MKLGLLMAKIDLTLCLNNTIKNQICTDEAISVSSNTSHIYTLYKYMNRFFKVIISKVLSWKNPSSIYGCPNPETKLNLEFLNVLFFQSS